MSADEVFRKPGDKLPPVSGASILDSVRDTLTQYVAFPSAASADAVTLWAAHTHAVDGFDSTPRLALLSPEPQCGKSRTLEVLELLVRDPLAVQSVTPAVLARTIDDHPTTVLLDEADAIFGPKSKEHEDLRAILNAGHRRGAGYARMVGEGSKMAAKTFSVFAPVALAGIGDLPETVMQRSVVLRMRRRAPGEHVEPFRYRKARTEIGPLRDDLAGWVVSVVGVLTDAEPVMPHGVTDRPADVWEPLLAVADAAGGQWPDRARAACLELIGNAASTSTASLGVRLLGDLRAVFGDVDRRHTDDLVARLVNLEESPWADLRGKPLDARGLSRRLSTYGVHPTQVKVDGVNRRGYRREDLHDPWSRYLSPETATAATAATPQVTASKAVALAEQVALTSATPTWTATESTPADLHGNAGSAGSGPSRGDDAPSCEICGQPLFLVRPGRTICARCTALSVAS
jgi:hypothetical protein